jgi:hypothetical protein
MICMKFLPRRQADVVIYGGHVHGVLAADGFDPASVGLTPADVTELGTLVSDGQTALDEVNAARLELQAKIKALNATNGTHARLVGKLRGIARSARTSPATPETLAEIGVSRNKTNQTPRTAPAESPQFTVGGVTPGVIHVRFRMVDSARPRARAEHTTGVQIAVVDGATAPADGEADTAWNVFVSHSPAELNATQMPRQVRLYARWITRRGHTGRWSLPVAVAVI